MQNCLYDIRELAAGEYELFLVLRGVASIGFSKGFDWVGEYVMHSDPYTNGGCHDCK
jgi:hypothetical protein